MSINKKILVTVAAGFILGTTSCRKFLDVNTDPNKTQVATVQTLLPAGQLLVGTALGVDMEIAGSIWSGYWTQSPNSSQYRSLEQYAPGQDAFSTTWSNLYAANENFKQLSKLADAQKKKHYKALSLMMTAYTYQLLADAWGDVPFSQALKGQPEDGGILNPKYDSLTTIYTNIMGYIDSAEALLAQTDAAGPGTDDLLFGGDVTKWQKFGYTLKLRMWLRLSEKNPTAAQAGIANLYATPGVAFLDVSEDAKITYGANSNNKSPLYAESSGLNNTQNLVASSTAVDSFNANFDDRAYVFYSYLSNGSIVGIPQGAYDITVAGGSFSVPSGYVGGDASDKLNPKAKSEAAPVVFMSAAESYFMQAEVEARGWAVTGNSDQVLWQNGIYSSFKAYDQQIQNEFASNGAPYNADTSINNYFLNGGYWTVYPTTGTLQDKLRFIITQKWFAMCGNQGFEAWTELRRTGYPDFFVPSAHSMIGLQTPSRFLYPTSESTRNSAFPGLKPITAKVWWDIL